jgi:hypothetical protein
MLAGWARSPRGRRAVAAPPRRCTSSRRKRWWWVRGQMMSARDGGTYARRSFRDDRASFTRRGGAGEATGCWMVGWLQPAVRAKDLQPSRGWARGATKLQFHDLACRMIQHEPCGGGRSKLCGAAQPAGCRRRRCLRSSGAGQAASDRRAGAAKLYRQLRISLRLRQACPGPPPAPPAPPQRSKAPAEAPCTRCLPAAQKVARRLAPGGRRQAEFTVCPVCPAPLDSLSPQTPVMSARPTPR